MTSDCVLSSDSNLVVKFADDTTVRQQVDELVTWCNENNVELNVSKTKEIEVDFRRRKKIQSPLIIDGSEVEQVISFRFFGIHVSSDLAWSGTASRRHSVGCSYCDVSEASVSTAMYYSISTMP